MEENSKESEKLELGDQTEMRDSAEYSWLNTEALQIRRLDREKLHSVEIIQESRNGEGNETIFFFTKRKYDRSH